MGIVDAFTPDDRLTITVPQLIDMCNYRADLAAENYLMRRGLENKIDHDTLLLLIRKVDENE